MLDHTHNVHFFGDFLHHLGRRHLPITSLKCFLVDFLGSIDSAIGLGSYLVDSSKSTFAKNLLLVILFSTVPDSLSMMASDGSNLADAIAKDLRL